MTAGCLCLYKMEADTILIPQLFRLSLVFGFHKHLPLPFRSRDDLNCKSRLTKSGVKHSRSEAQSVGLPTFSRAGRSRRLVAFMWGFPQSDKTCLFGNMGSVFPFGQSLSPHYLASYRPSPLLAHSEYIGCGRFDYVIRSFIFDTLRRCTITRLAITGLGQGYRNLIREVKCLRSFSCYLVFEPSFL